MLVLGMRVSQNGPAFTFFSISSLVWIFLALQTLPGKEKQTHEYSVIRITPNAKPEYTISHSVSKVEGTKSSLLGRKRRRCQSQTRSKDKKSPDDILSCGNAGLGSTHCCQAGDICLENIYCLNKELNVTYIGDCSDPNYEIDSCFHHYYEREFGRGTIVAGTFYSPYLVEPPFTPEKKNLFVGS